MTGSAVLSIGDTLPDADMGDPTEYTIDELATATRVPSRTIRFYQSEGALPKPTIKGRVAYYGPAHVERLAQITALQDRGLQIKAIRDVLTRAERGEFSLQEWLGSHDQLSSPWASDRPKVMTEDERRGDAYLVESPSLLGLALRLDAVGMPLHTVEGAFRILGKQLGRLADDLAAYFIKNADALGDDLDKAYGELRPVSMEAVRVVFAREMDRTLRKTTESAAAAFTRSKRKKKPTR
jgi:DNA-binding transcriptional MerR regulator